MHSNGGAPQGAGLIAGVQDTGELAVKVNPETMNVTIDVRGPLQVQPQSIILNGYQFLAIFGGALGVLGDAMFKTNDRMLRSRGLTQ